MKTGLKSEKSIGTLLFTCDPETSWNQVKQIIKNELNSCKTDTNTQTDMNLEFNKQILYKISDMCRILEFTSQLITVINYHI